MKVREKIKHFWVVTLGVDCPDEVSLADSNKPEDKELIESLERVAGLEKKYKVANTSFPKGGKGSNSKVVERVETNPSKAVEKAVEKAEEQKIVNGREER